LRSSRASAYPRELRGRANGAFRTIVLCVQLRAPAVLSAIVVFASSAAVAFAVAGGLSFAAAAVGAVTPLRDYAARESRWTDAS
jgi:hypothetical protein